MYELNFEILKKLLDFMYGLGTLILTVELASVTHKNGQDSKVAHSVDETKLFL
jgi:hypothetical protein